MLILNAALIFGALSPARAACPQWAEAAARNLAERDLAQCSCDQLDLLRNEIYARHGRVFNRQDLQSYFSAQSWYQPDRGNIDGTRGQNAFEQRNAATILNYEKKAGCREGTPPPPPPTGACPAWPAPASRYLSDNDLSACSCRDLELLRNEIYARHGRVFNRQDLQAHFSAQPWYRPDRSNPNGDKGQNAFERGNATRILNQEQSRGCKAGPAGPSASTSTSSCPAWPAPAARNLTLNELAACSCRDLELLRNEIYARHGRIFKRQDLQQYFNNRSWYAPDPDNPNGDRGQNQFERNNVERIKNYEKSKGCKP